jgi:orotidine-5'-phosphate decarboxylase
MSAFVERLQAASRARQSLVCVGLDPDPELMPVPDVLEFNKAIVDATSDLVCAYKPNLPFYEALGIPGLEALAETISHIRAVAPEAIVLGDGKRGDIASTNVKYAQALFGVWGFDAATVNGYAGGESLEPFLSYADRGIFVWCRSSNPGAGEFQDLRLVSDADGPHPDPPPRGEGRRNPLPPWGRVRVGAAPTLYEWMAQQASEWNTRGNVGLVVGATFPDQLKSVRTRCPGMPILVPGVGAQGGELESSVRSGLDKEAFNILISSSRGIIYASRDRKDYARAAREAAMQLRDRINRILIEEGRPWQ